MTPSRPALPFHRLPKGRYPAELRSRYEELVDEYGDERLGLDPRATLSAMLAVIRAAERPRRRDEHKMLLTLRRANEVTSGSFHCPACYETRFPCLMVSLVVTQHGTPLRFSGLVLSVAPGGCQHREVRISCATCAHEWAPSHSISAESDSFDPYDPDPDPSPKKKNTEPN